MVVRKKLWIFAKSSLLTVLLWAMISSTYEAPLTPIENMLGFVGLLGPFYVISSFWSRRMPNGEPALNVGFTSAVMLISAFCIVMFLSSTGLSVGGL